MSGFDGWTPAMLKSRIHAIAETDRSWIESLQCDREQLTRERNELFRLLLLGGDTRIWGKPVHIDTTLIWQEGRPPFGGNLEDIAGSVGP